MAVSLVIGLLIGGAVAAFVGGGGRDEPEAPATTSDITRDGDPEAAAELPELVEPVRPEQATDPELAIQSFLSLEATGEWEASYEFLTEDLRTVAFTSPAAWVAAHADFPTVTGYRLDGVSVDEDGERATARTLTGFDAKLDPVLGLVAARGRSDWLLESEGDVWRVNVADLAAGNTFLYPASDGAEVTARRWVDARVACEDTTDLQAGLIGSPVLAEQLCNEDQDEPVEIGAVSSLSDSADTSTLQSEFGPQVFAWGRTVEVEAETPLIAVLGPIDNEWRVVAVLPSR